MSKATIETIINLYEKTKAPTILFDENMNNIWANKSANENYPFLKTHSGVFSLLSIKNEKNVFLNLEKLKRNSKLADNEEVSEKTWTFIQELVTPFMTTLTLNFTLFESSEDEFVYLCTIIPFDNTHLEKQEQENNFLFSLASYHIREPLFYIFSAIDTLKLISNDSTFENREKMEMYLDAMLDSSYKILRAITSISKYYRLLNDSYSLEEAKETFYLNKHIEILCHAVHITTTNHCVPFFYNITDIDMLVNLNPEMIVTVLLHLISNAFLYTKEGNKIYLSLKQENNRAIITIKDHGTGIEASRLENIFTPFSSSQYPISENHGIGLGIPISNLIAIKEGGTLKINSKVNIGTEAIFELPLEPKLHTESVTLHQNNESLISDKFSSIYTDLAGIAKRPKGG